MLCNRVCEMQGQRAAATESHHVQQSLLALLNQRTHLHARVTDNTAASPSGRSGPHLHDECMIVVVSNSRLIDVIAGVALSETPDIARASARLRTRVNPGSIESHQHGALLVAASDGMQIVRPLVAPQS